jgi:hypothetical protein
MDQYDSYSLSGYEFVDQGILYLTLLCTFHHKQSLNHTVVIYYKFYYIAFI